MHKKIALVAAALAVALSLQAGFAGEKRPDHPNRRDRPGEEYRRPMRPGMMAPGMFGFGHGFMGELELTDAQKTQMADLLTARFREGLLARMEMAEAGRKLHDLASSENPDKDAVIAANQALGTARGKLEALFLTAREEMRKVLTPEQQTKLNEMRDEMRGRRFGGRDADGDDDDDGPRGGRWGGMRERGMRGPGFGMGCCN